MSTRNQDIFHRSLLERKISLHINQVGSNIKQNLEDKLNAMISEKCVSEGFIRSGTINIVTYTSGDVVGDQIVFTCAFECDVCNPVENMHISCSVNTVTKAGVHCEYVDPISKGKPLQIFIARDHHYNDTDYNELVENDNIRVKVVGTRYELHDPHICVISTLVK